MMVGTFDACVRLRLCTCQKVNEFCIMFIQVSVIFLGLWKFLILQSMHIVTRCWYFLGVFLQKILRPPPD